MKILYLLIAALKFLGISILLLLLLVLLLVIIVLTVPIKYRVYLNKSEDMYVYTNVKWLYSIISMDIIYNSGSKITKKLKLFGKAIGPRKLKRKVVKELDYNLNIERIQNQKKDIDITNKAPNNRKKVKKEKDNKGGILEMIEKIQSFRYKKELLTDTISWLRRVLKSIAPSTLYTEIEIGKEDPADTGHLIAIVSALHPLYYSFANIVGNYEKECFYAKLEANGDITLGKLVYDLSKYIRTSSVKELIKYIRKNRKGKKDGRKVTK